MLFSIVIPVYNVEQYLPECLDSIIAQDVMHTGKGEIILVDDGSTDKSGAICDAYAKKYAGMISVFHNENRGLLRTRRFGYEHAQGKYIINCDSDDSLERDALSCLLEKMETNVDVIIFNGHIYDGINKSPFFQHVFDSVDGVIKKEDVLAEFLSGHRIVSLCLKCYKKACIDLNFDYQVYTEISNGEDTLQSIEIFTNAESFCYVDKCLYNYRQASGMTAKFDPNYYRAFLSIIGRIESCKERWRIGKFDELVALKYFQSTGRAITQIRYAKKFGFVFVAKYLKEIRNCSSYRKYSACMGAVSDRLQNSHRFVLTLLNKRLYGLIFGLLWVSRLKNR